MKFGERLKQARIEMDLTQGQVANDFFITRQTISSWENEKTYPDISSLIRLSDYYHISLDILLKEDVGMRESLEKKEVSEELRPVRRNLILIDLILFVVLLGNLFNVFKINGGFLLFILLILLCTISALSDLNNFDKSYLLGLKYEWQKYISGDKVDLSQYLGHILVETVTPFLLLPTLQTPVRLDSESSYGFDFGYKILQCS
ncbi:helix-turn-helix domain-containing protein [Liquorilactobacillus hordei]|uniref:helix-turn-helix domain-containing protein n=2 Tax=Liquorilactobacillus hordei TaxID=468911 RepID=UPI001CC11C31|nr:helix-turn-helix transcriptional regulator [Liquorilactobacillus hordei]MBZ2405880.1 transcriptional regulator [Liquorilactobacillus hordei]